MLSSMAIEKCKGPDLFSKSYWNTNPYSQDHFILSERDGKQWHTRLMCAFINTFHWYNWLMCYELPFLCHNGRVAATEVMWQVLRVYCLGLYCTLLFELLLTKVWSSVCLFFLSYLLTYKFFDRDANNSCAKKVR